MWHCPWFGPVHRQSSALSELPYAAKSPDSSVSTVTRPGAGRLRYRRSMSGIYKGPGHHPADWTKEVLVTNLHQADWIKEAVMTNHDADSLCLQLKLPGSKFITPRCLVFLVRVALRWKWAWSAGGVMYWWCEHGLSSKIATCPSATLCTTNLTWTDLESNPCFRGKMQSCNCLSHATAVKRCQSGLYI